MSNQRKRFRISMGKETTTSQPPAKRMKNNQYSEKDQIKQLQNLQAKKDDAIAKLEAQHEREMQGLESKFDKQIDKMKQKLSDDSKQRLCVYCNCETYDEKCYSCENPVCESCMTICNSNFSCGKGYCEECVASEFNVEKCCGGIYCDEVCSYEHQWSCAQRTGPVGW
eukprot:129902_1